MRSRPVPATERCGRRSGGEGTGRAGQHGLEIVMAVAQSVEARREPGGKSITVRLPLE
ncbi:hypothetical protein GGE06_007648 [Streptomyces sp. SFB5A]|jgi:hypothetical protein|uniref:Histidine kinase/HSP90-like ATPase domain-containing protein n=1 Tax=Streptomyces nymphaeiformis TaxID=2663842 RepID=A0A7W7U7U9_9ACTN|nr:hypothetical protein [Streptomyces nymphaeiformis]